MAMLDGMDEPLIEDSAADLELIVNKIGGTSAADADMYRFHSRKIEETNLIGLVISAPGNKWYDGKSSRVTRLLTSIYEKANSDADFSENLGEVTSRFLEITHDLGLEKKKLSNGGVIDYADYIRKELDWRIGLKEKLDNDDLFQAMIESAGEFLAANILADYHTMQVDEGRAKKKVRLLLPEECGYNVMGDNPRNSRKTEDSITNLARASEDTGFVYIMPGFYGVLAGKDGKPIELGSWDGSRRFVIGTYRKGGSDITGVDLTAALSLNRPNVVNFNLTDKPGIAVINPTIEDAVKYVGNMGPSDARELTDAGFTVLVPQAMDTMEKFGFNIWVKSTFDLDEDGKPLFQMAEGKREYKGSWNGGTLITRFPDYRPNPNPEIVGLAYKGGISSVKYNGDKSEDVLRDLAKLVKRSMAKDYGIDVSTPGGMATSSGIIYFDFKYEEGVVKPDDTRRILDAAINTVEKHYGVTMDRHEVNNGNRSLLKVVGPEATSTWNKLNMYKAFEKASIETDYDSAIGDRCMIFAFKERLGNPTAIAMKATKTLSTMFFNGNS